MLQKIRIFVLITITITLTSCLGWKEETATTFWELPEERSPVGTIKIMPVTNSSGNKIYDDFKHYSHIATAYGLYKKYDIDCDLTGIGELGIPRLKLSKSKPEYTAHVNILEVSQHSGGTLKIGLFSRSSDNTVVKLHIKISKNNGETILDKTFEEEASNAVYGVVAEVKHNRSLKEIDQSAAAAAIKSIMDKL